jgi:hypothetical protein
MFRREDIQMEKPFTFIYCASLPMIELSGYGFSEEQAIKLLELQYNKYLDSFLEKREDLTPISTQAEI